MAVELEAPLFERAGSLDQALLDRRLIDARIGRGHAILQRRGERNDAHPGYLCD